ncbi:MAG: DUF952 domain-containing protein [Rhodospirillales bacterium]|jgi:uncharacterized protein (DUF952 family)|nr:DUF952 domain-containing protein [Rhodospirillales bacterium]
MSDQLIFHMCKSSLWQAVQQGGLYRGSGDDIADGFIHFSTADQLVESVARHRAGITGLLLIAVNPDDLGKALKWEPSRRGQLFPHLYGPLEVSKVISADKLPLGEDGIHVFPDSVLSSKAAKPLMF